MIIRWVCKDCNKKWIYPIKECMYCQKKTQKEIGKEMKVIGMTKINIPSPMHPITPYTTLMLQDEHGNLMPKKTMKDYEIGDIYKREKAKTKNAVSIIKIKYDIYEAVKEAVELIGGIEVNKDSKILIKPNLFMPAYPYQAITTNPLTIEAIIKYLIEKGVAKENIKIAELVQYGVPEAAAIKTGTAKIAKELGVEILDLEKSEYIEKEVSGVKLEISKEFLNKDLIINVPAMKTHMLLGVSGALENMSRALSKKTYENMEKDIELALKSMIILHKILPKYLTIADATIGMQGNGPALHGESAFLNMIFAGYDSVALDKVFEEMALLRKSPMIKEFAKAGVGTGKIEDIEVVGEELDACKRELMQPIGSKLIKK